jgi:AcrR family transcriptional regulator
MITNKQETISSGFSTKEKILESAKKLFSNYGYSAVSMSEIAKEVKITKAALYYHFKSKKEIYLEVMQKSFEALLEKLKKPIGLKTTFEKKFHQTLMAYLEFSLNEKNPIQETIQKISRLDRTTIKFTQKLQWQIIKKFEDLIKEGQKKKKLLSNLSSRAVARFVIGLMDTTVVQKDFVKNKKFNPKKSVNEIMKLLFLEK